MFIPTKTKGDSFDITITIGEDITNWKIRCEIYDSTHKIQLASANSGGSNDEIEIIVITQGKFQIHVAKNLTTNFKDKSNIEVEVETDDSPSKKYTVIQEEIRFKNERINWDTPE